MRALPVLAAVALVAPAGARTEVETLFDGTSLADRTIAGEGGWSLAESMVAIGTSAKD